MSAGGNASESAIASAVTGPKPSSRLRTISTSASSRVHVRAANSAGASIAGVAGVASMQRVELRQALGRDP